MPENLPIIDASVNDDLKNVLESAAVTVFTTMLETPLEIDRSDEPFTEGEYHIAGAVGLTGAYNGIIYLSSTAAFARKMTCRLLGMQDEEIEGDDMVNDAFGELTNMVAGVIKSNLENLNRPCIMTVPSVVRGSNFTIEAVTGVERRSVYCVCDGGRVLVEALIKTADTQELA
jgi:chemotaxis protein CheX